MTDKDDGFTVEQAAAANKALRNALGLPPERFATDQFVGMISDEIEQLRSAGKSDEEIADILAAGAGVEISPHAITKFYAEPSERDRAR